MTNVISIETRRRRDPFYENIADTIKIYGQQVLGVGGTETEPSFSYTIGLFEKHGFELLLFAVPPQYAVVILNDIAASLANGFVIEDGRVYSADGPENTWVAAPVMFKDTVGETTHKKYTIQADRYYEKVVPVKQIVVPDRAMLMPDHPDFDHAYMDRRQPLLY